MNKLCTPLLCTTLCAMLMVATLPSQDTSTTPASTPNTEAKTYFWLGMWPDFLIKFDPETDEVVQKVKLRGGLNWGVTLSHDQKQFFVITDLRRKLEVVDLEKGEVINEHDFSEPDHIIRIRSVREIPGGTHWYVNVDRIELVLDHFVIHRPQWLRYDIANKTVDESTDELPEPIRSRARISPDGTKWHVFDGDILILDPETLEEEATIDLTTPLYTGLGAIRPVGDDFYHLRNPDKYRMLYTMSDPVQEDRSLFGIVDISIADAKVEGITEWGANPGYRGFFMSKDRKLGVGQTRGDGEGYERRVKLALFDLETGRKLVETLEQFPPRRQLTAISPDGTKIYVGGAGNHFLVLNDKLERVNTVEFEGDLHGFIYIVDG